MNLKIDKKLEKRKLQTRLKHAASGIDLGYRFSSFIYDNFVENNKESIKVTKSIVEYETKSKLEHGAFTSYRNKLENSGWICLKDKADRNEGRGDSEVAYWKPGPELIYYINNQSRARSKENSTRLSLLEVRVGELEIQIVDKDLRIKEQSELIESLRQRIRELEKEKKNENKEKI